MAESLKSRMARLGFNFFPVYRRMGGRITYIADDWSEVRVKLPLNWKTRNYVGTIYGGSMYGVIDPIYMLMLIKLLGPDFTVWDKGASIQFHKPGRSTLFARFIIEASELDRIRFELGQKSSIERIYQAALKDSEGTVHASFEKIIYIRDNKN